jgi:hypothetical protein
MRERQSGARFAGRATWNAGLLASFTARDTAFSDDTIFAMLHAADESMSAADLCAAHGVTLPMYCVWKTKYRNLTFQELCDLRRQEHRRVRTLRAVLITSMALGAGAIGLSLAAWMDRSAEGDVGRAVHHEQPVSSVATTGLPSIDAADGPHTPRDTAEHRAARPQQAIGPLTLPEHDIVSQQPDAGASLERFPTSTPAPAGPDGYSVQVAAMPDLKQARMLVEQLEAAGHSAYLVAVTVRNEELYRVRVGPFESRDIAQETVRRLLREGRQGAWIAR